MSVSKQEFTKLKQEFSKKSLPTSGLGKSKKNQPKMKKLKRKHNQNKSKKYNKIDS